MPIPVCGISSSLPFPGINYAGPWTVRNRQWSGLSITSYSNNSGTCTVAVDHTDGEMLCWHWSPAVCFKGAKRAGVVEMARDFLKKAVAKQEAKQADFEAECEKFEKGWPNLYGFMACNVGLEDSSVRIRSTIKIFVEGGRFKACLNDLENDCSLFVTLDDPRDWADALEQGLEQERPDWRKWGKKKK